MLTLWVQSNACRLPIKQLTSLLSPPRATKCSSCQVWLVSMLDTRNLLIKTTALRHGASESVVDFDQLCTPLIFVFAVAFVALVALVGSKASGNCATSQD